MSINVTNLDDLLKGLEAETGIEKAASVAPEATATPDISTALTSILEKVSETDLTAKAAAEGEALAAGLLTKIAGEIKKDDNTKENTQMSKLANLILEKLAEGEGSPSQADVGLQAPANLIQEGTALQHADATQKVQPTPGTDTEASVNQIFEAIVQKAVAQGGGSDNLVINQPTATEGVGIQAAEHSNQEEAQEKVAAVQALVEAGYDFETSVDLVKQAEAAIQADEFEQEKQAAFNALVGAGVDFDTAVALVKQAEEDLAKKA